MGIGTDFAHAVAAKDREALERLLAPGVDFRALTPRRPWEGSRPEEVSEVFFDGAHVAEQQAYHRSVDGRITYLRVLCSGFRPR